MGTNKRKKKNVLTVQLFECAMVAVCVEIGYLFASKLMYNAFFPFGITAGVLIYAIISIAVMVALGACGYFGIKEKPLPKSAARVIFVLVILNLVFIALLYFSRSIRLSPYYFVVADAFQMALLMLLKLLFRCVKEEILSHNVSLIIGSECKRREVVKTFRSAGIEKTTFVSMNDPRLMEYIERADSIYMAAEMSKKQKDEIISCCILREKDIYLVPETYEIALWKSRLTQIGDIPVFNIETFKITEAQNLVKRTMDVMGSLTGLILLSPIMLVVALLIKKEDGGPVFYSQVRSGKGGKEFKVVKFRSMRPDAEKLTGAVFATDGDPRITKVGKKLRAARLDEIPQFINVLKGEMSLVGPRPERPVFVNEFAKTIPEFKNRLAVKPGITGMAQVMGNYTTTPENKVRFDMMYIRDYSLLMDIKILFQTFKVVLTKEQAVGFEDESELEDGFHLLQTEPGLQAVHKSHRMLKGVLITACCLAIVTGSMLLRYASIAMDVFAMTKPILIQAINDSNDSAEVVAALVADPSQPMDDPGIASRQGSETPDNSGSNERNADMHLGIGGKNTRVGASANGGELSDGSGQSGKQGVRVKMQSDALGSPSGYGISITEEEIQNAFQEISMSDKINLAYKLLTKLKADDMIQLEQMAIDGFTEEEKENAKEMVYQYFDDEEIRQIYQLYVKYIK